MLHIDYHEIANNAKKIKSKCNTPLCAVVKSDAYGHGAVPVAKWIRKLA